MRRIAVLWVAAAVLMASGADGRPKGHDPWLDVPHMLDVANADPHEHSWLTEKCRLTRNTPPRQISCTYSLESLMPPGAKATARDVAGWEKARHGKSGRKLFHGICGHQAAYAKMIARGGPTTVYAGYLQRLKDACSKNDFGAFINAQEWQIREIEAKTCEHTTFLGTEQFTQQDANTWVRVDTGPGLCFVSSTKMLWRKKGADFWNYHETSVPSANPPKYCVPAKTQEFRWMVSRVVDPGCKYVKY